MRKKSRRNYDDQTVLKEFYDLCERISCARFYNSDTARGPFRMVENGEVVHEIPYDEEDFQSFVLLFRRLLLNDEPTYIYRVLKAIARLSDDDDRKDIRRVRKYLKGVEKGTITVEIEYEGRRRSLNHREVYENIVNAKYAHGDLDRKAIYERLNGMPNGCRWVVAKFCLELSDAAINIAEIARNAGLIETPTPE